MLHLSGVSHLPSSNHWGGCLYHGIPPKSSIPLRDFPLKILKTIQLLCYDCVVPPISSSMGPTPNGGFPGSGGCWDSHLKSPVPEVQAAITGQWNKKTQLGLVKLRVMGESVGYPWISMDQRSAEIWSFDVILDFDVHSLMIFDQLCRLYRDGVWDLLEIWNGMMIPSWLSWG